MKEKSDKVSLILDSIEKILVIETKDLMKRLGHEVDEQGARNILSKIGARILYADSLGKERVDEILMRKK